MSPQTVNPIWRKSKWENNVQFPHVNSLVILRNKTFYARAPFRLYDILVTQYEVEQNLSFYRFSAFYLQRLFSNILVGQLISINIA